MAKKQYKNVFTIMEKVRKGELDATGSSRFTSILGSYKKPELVKPYVHYIDAYRLDTLVSKGFKAGYGSDLSHTATKIQEMRGAERWNFDESEVTETYNNLPKSLKNDVFNMFNKPIDKIDFEARTSKNQMRYKLLELANDPSLKILTEGSNIKSGLFTKSMMTYLTYFMLRLKKKDEEAYEEMKKQLNDTGDGKGDGDESDDKNPSASSQSSGSGKGKSSAQMENLINKAIEQTKKALDQEMNKTVEQVNDLTEHIGSEELEQAWENKGMGANMSKDELEKAVASLKRIKLNEDALKRNIKVILDKSKNYFSGQERITHESLFESGNFDGLEDYAFLHPKLRQIFPEDITTKNVERRGKINLYVDISGSMSDSCGVVDNEGRSLDKLEFAKAVALVMKKNNMLNKLYSFNNDIHIHKTSDFAIATMSHAGGTNLTKVVQHVINSEENSLVLTDAEDRCHLYSDKIFWLGVKGSRFNYFRDEVLKLYHEKQMSVFDGDKILSVNVQGHTY